MTKATNSEAENIMGLRIPEGSSNDVSQSMLMEMQPSEFGFICPIHRFHDDDLLEWSPYNAFLYCQRCDKHYPSVLCVDLTESSPGESRIFTGVDAAVNVFLMSVRELLDRKGVV